MSYLPVFNQTVVTMGAEAGPQSDFFVVGLFLGIQLYIITVTLKPRPDARTICDSIQMRSPVVGYFAPVRPARTAHYSKSKL